MKKALITIRNRLARILGIRPEPYYVTTVLRDGLTLDAWRTSPTRIAYARGLFRMIQFREILTVLMNASPIPDGSRPDEAQIQLGRVIGYNECLQNLTSLADEPLRPAPEIEATYETPTPQDSELSE